MLKVVLISSMFVALALSTYVTDIDNNFIEYDIDSVQHMQTIPLPYQHVLIKPAPVYTENIILPATELEVSSPGLISSTITCALQLVKSGISFLLTNVPALAVGTAVALGVCKLTALCGSDLTIIEVQRELRSIASSDRIASVTDFVMDAVRKFGEMQDK